MTEQPLIALGVTGGIAAYKAADLCSRLRKAGFQVQVLMTENALRFVGEITFRTLSRRRVITGLWDDENEWRPEHVALADEAKLLIVAPATANFLAKYSCGIADDALTTFAVTFHGPVLVAPAMNPAMWSHPACVENQARLRARGVHFIGPDAGAVACGADGVGRLCDVQKIVEEAQRLLSAGN